jgi:hypothetical protein
MKNLITAIMLFLAIITTAQGIQKDSTRVYKNEIKLNLVYSLLAAPEITYERILRNSKSIGFSLLHAYNDEFGTTNSKTIFYRSYFNDKQASGFFIEPNFHHTSKDNSYYYNGVTHNSKLKSAGMGISVGGKFYKKNWVVEVYGGIGRLFRNTGDLGEIYPRLGINMGRRF